MEGKIIYTSNTVDEHKEITRKHFEIYLKKFNLTKDEVQNKHYMQWIKSNMEQFKRMNRIVSNSNTPLYKEKAPDFIKFLEEQ